MNCGFGWLVLVILSIQLFIDRTQAFMCILIWAIQRKNEKNRDRDFGAMCSYVYLVHDGYRKTNNSRKLMIFGIFREIGENSAEEVERI